MDKGKFNVNVFIPKNNSLFISIIFIFLLFAVIIYIKPQLFLFLFNDVLGNLLLVGLVAGVGVFDIKWSLGLGAIFIILYQATHIASKKGLEGLEGLEGSSSSGGSSGSSGGGARCPAGCVAPTETYGNCTEINNGKQLSCPWQCPYSNSLSPSSCSYDSDCAACQPPVIFDQVTRCHYTQYGCCPDGVTNKWDPEGSNCPDIGGCDGTEFGCCPDGVTPKANASGTNCAGGGGIIGGCAGTEFGCCADGVTPKANMAGTNCAGSIIGGCAGTEFGCCADGVTPKANMAGTNCLNGGCAGTIYGCCPDEITAKHNCAGTNCPSSYGPYNPYFPDLPAYNASSWPQQVINDFIKFEQTHNPTYKFDVNIIQQQASVAEVQYLLKNNKWPWSDEVKKLFRDAMAQNNYISTNLNASLDNAQSIYNQAAILEILSWNSKEGQFLLNGSIIGHSDNLPANINNVIKCVASMGGSGNDIKMQKIVYTGYDSLDGSLQSQTSSVEDSDLPSLITGFKFLRGSCNPCSALTQPPGYSCPFSIDTGNGADVSPVWQNLWGLNAASATTAGSATAGQFPLLNELKREISLATFISDANISSSGLSTSGSVGPNVASTLNSSALLMGSGAGAGAGSGAILTNTSDNTDAIMPGNLQDVDYNIPRNMN